jgi:predicted O-methyltransferase YrrM
VKLPALLAEWRALPPAVAWFRLRARRLATQKGDEFTLRSVTRADELGKLLELARGCRHVVELGTGTAWTAIALALADRAREVVSYDPLVWDGRDEYLALAGAARERIMLVKEPGENGPLPGAATADLLFIDSSHDLEPTLAEFRAWRDKLAPGAIVAFHDYDEPAYPGVTEAVRRLGLDGEIYGHMFIWHSG